MQLPNVSSKYGAPMGRHSHGVPDMCGHRDIRVFKVRINNGGYDTGGAYWGNGALLWCATDGEAYTQFLRADSRLQAIVAFDIHRDLLARAPRSKFQKLRELESRGCISAAGIVLIQKLEALGF